jgi:voltage-gated potassium channel
MDFARLRTSLTLFALIVGVGTAGYTHFEQMPVFDAFYMTLITISTVGFAEIKPLSPVGRAITVFIIITGISVGTYTLGMLVKVFVEGELQKLFGRRKLEKQVAALRDHYIICGFGRIGRIISQDLQSEGIAFIVIERDATKLDQLDQRGYLYLNQDAATEQALLDAGIMRARGLVTAVRSDANNVFITLTAKGLRPDIYVMARASDEANVDKLQRAGATRVVCPYQLGGRRMAQMLKRPTVVDFIDTATGDADLGLIMEEAVLGPRSELIGKSLIDSRLRQNYGVIVVAIKKISGEMIYNPAPDHQLAGGDVIVAIGKRDDLRRMDAVLG